MQRDLRLGVLIVGLHVEVDPAARLLGDGARAIGRANQADRDTLGHQWLSQTRPTVRSSGPSTHTRRGFLCLMAA
jgi:hypothetical protein